MYGTNQPRSYLPESEAKHRPASVEGSSIEHRCSSQSIPPHLIDVFALRALAHSISQFIIFFLPVSMYVWGQALLYML
jgi:hypothetical protein